MHRDEPFCVQVAEDFDRFVRSHVHMPKRIGVVGANRQKRDLRRAPVSNFFEAFEIRAVTGMENSTALMFENKPAIASMFVVNHARSPMSRRSQRYFPIAMAEAFP